MQFVPVNRPNNMKGISFAAFVVLTTAVTQIHAGDTKIVSKFSSTSSAKALSYEETGEEGDPGFNGRFRGFGGSQLEHIGGDERSWINIRYGKETVDLRDATMEAGGGTFPHKANDAVEWRGVEKAGRFVPHAIIYRLKAGNDETRVWHTRLIVIKLDRARSAVVGHAEGANEEAEAKRIADACLK
jgi:hypothetical protein